MEHDNNVVRLIGTVTTEPEFNYKSQKVDYYKIEMEVKRNSGAVDIVPIVFSREKLSPENTIKGKRIQVCGKYKSHSLYKSGRHKLLLYVLADSMEESDVSEDFNEIYLEGVLCKNPIVRDTPKGRVIADLMVAINGSTPREQSSYIPCIAWGGEAKRVANYVVGEKVQLKGRVQSRDYIKKIDEDNCETRTAYEISAKNVNLVLE